MCQNSSVGATYSDSRKERILSMSRELGDPRPDGSSGSEAVGVVGMLSDRSIGFLLLPGDVGGAEHLAGAPIVEQLFVRRTTLA